jgi:predicted nucleic acid-binding protein
VQRFFIDSSALLRRVLLEGDVAPVDELLSAGATTSTLAEVEVGVSIMRRRHAGEIDEAQADGCLRSALDLFDRLVRVDLTPAVRKEAIDVARTHRVRSLDAIQLASAAVQARIGRRHGNTVGFCTADRRQAEAARSIFGERRTVLLDPL